MEILLLEQRTPETVVELTTRIPTCESEIGKEMVLPHLVLYWDTEGYLVLRRQTCVFLAPSHSSSEPTVANRMYLPSELCAMTSTQCPAVLLAPTNASAAPSRRAARDTEG